MQNFSQTVLRPKRLLLVFVLLNLVVGIFIVKDYGTSTDEGWEFARSSLALKMYTGALDGAPEQAYYNLDPDHLAQYYGTAHSTILRIIGKFSNPGNRLTYDPFAHYYYFLYFQAAVAGIFLLARLFVSEWSSLGVAVIFGTQPLLFGHGFINSKDTPMATVFLLAVVAGFYMVDRWEKTQTSQFDRSNQRMLVWLAALASLLWLKNPFTGAILKVIEYAYNTRGESIPGKLFSTLTTSGSLAGYLTLTEMLIDDIYRWLCLAAFLAVIILFIRHRRKSESGAHIDLQLLLAAAMWGFAISTRVIAIAAGGIVGLYGLLRFRRRSLFPLTAYTLTASIFAYITWPLFWVHGLRGLWDALRTHSQYPYIRSVLFEGRLIPAQDVPPTYIPKLLLLQFTEPAVVLMLIGAVIGLVLIVKNKVNRIQLGLVYLWFLLPLAYNMANDFTRYANFRQFLFIIPPLFVFTGLALEQAGRRMKDKARIAALSVLIAIPGIISLIQLHPYQYIYYNQFVGGVEGAFREYELDYWKTSYIDAWEYINENIPEGSKILSQVTQNFDNLYAEHEYTFASIWEVDEQDYGEYDYALLDTRLNWDQGLLPDAPVVYELKVDHATLILIKEIPKENR